MQIKKILKNRIVGNYIWVFFGQNVGSIFSMIALIFTLKIITTYEYGTLTIIQTYCLLISDLVGMRTFNGIIKYLTEAESVEDYQEAKKIINSGYFLDFLTGIIGYILSFFLLPFVSKLMGWEDVTISCSVRLFATTIIFLPMLNGTATGVLRKFGYFKQVNILHSLVYGLHLFALIIIYFLGVKNFYVVLLAYALLEIIESIVLLCYSVKVLQKSECYHSFFKAGLSTNLKFVKYNFSYGILLTFDQILGNLSTLLINKYIGNLGTAYLKIITRICSMFTKMTKPISQVFYPELCRWISENKYKQAWNISLKYFYTISGFGVILLAIVYFTYDWWIVIFDPGMTVAKTQSMFYLVYSILSSSVICIHQMSYALNMMRFNIGLVGFFDLLYLVLLIPFVSKGGVNAYLLLQILQLLAVFIGKMIYIKMHFRRNKILELCK